MNYLSVENISKSFGVRTLFEGVSFGINKDQKIAFVAKNGSGKSTITPTMKKAESLLYISSTHRVGL